MATWWRDGKENWHGGYNHGGCYTPRDVSGAGWVGDQTRQITPTFAAIAPTSTELSTFSVYIRGWFRQKHGFIKLSNIR